MNEKLEESAQYLRCCSNIEIEAFKLYEKLSKKINYPESSYILGFAYDSLKCAKITQGLVDNFDLPETENMNCKKNLSALATEISIFSKKLSKINNLNYEIFCEILKELIALEDLIGEAYTTYVQSPTTKILADELSKIVTVDLNNFKKIFETFVEQKEKHRETIIEIMYCYEAKEADRLRHIAPLIKYQNPDSWIRQSTLHAFSNTPVKENTAP